MRKSAYIKAVVLLSMIIVVAMPVVAGTGQTMDKGKDLISASSEAMQYTVSYPSSWVAAIKFSNEGMSDSMVLEQARFTTPDGAEVSITVWDRTAAKSLDAWLVTNAELLNLVDRKVSTRKLSQAGVEGKVYLFDSSGGQVANRTKTYLLMDGKIYEVSYYMSDNGAATEQYWAFINSLTPGITGSDLLLPAERVPELQDSSKVYSCGGYSDTCYCNAWNPFPCCSNDANCTWWGWHKACCNWGIDIPPRGNANSWDETFNAYGYWHNSCSYPAVGWIGVSNSGYYGHVAWVEQISGDYVQVSEQNCNYGAGGVHYTWYHKCWFDAGYYHP